MNARERLAVAILSMPRSQRLPCATDHKLWTSHDSSERARAARTCLACPVVEPCREAGAGESWGVWGGVDRSAPAAEVAAA